MNVLALILTSTFFVFLSQSHSVILDLLRICASFAVKRKETLFFISTIMNLHLEAFVLEDIPDVRILAKMKQPSVNELLLTFRLACIEMDVSCSNPQKIASSI